MFAPGNGTERIRFAQMKLQTKDELVIDMFTGLGYFTLPFAKFHPDNIRRIIALEKNPVSFQYLCQNVALNKLDTKVFKYSSSFVGSSATLLNFVLKIFRLYYHLSWVKFTRNLLFELDAVEFVQMF